MCEGKGVGLGLPPHGAQGWEEGQELAVEAGNSSPENADACRCSEKQGGGGSGNSVLPSCAGVKGRN